MKKYRFKYFVYFTLSWLSLLLERLWNRLWPVFSLAVFFAALALFNIPAMFGVAWHLFFISLFVTASAIAFFLTPFSFSIPSRGETERHMEKASILPHRPLETLHDKPAYDLQEDSLNLWRKHLQKTALYIRDLRIYTPQPDVARHDRWALRHAALILLAVGLAVAQRDAIPRLQVALTPDIGSLMTQKTAALDLWIAPPEYTGQPAIFLSNARQGVVTHGEVEAPQGSLLKLRLSGFRYAPRLQYDGKSYPLKEAAAQNFTLELPLEKSGVLRLAGLLQRLGQWSVIVHPDTAPEISISKIEATPRSAVRITYNAADDHGISKLTATVGPAPGRPDQLPEKSVSFDITPSRTNGENSHVEDLTSHAWVGQPATLMLEAEDKAGHKTASAPMTFVMPERTFTNPVAQRLIEQRKLLLQPNVKTITMRGVAKELAEIADRPSLYNDDHSTFLILSVALRRLIYDGSPAAAEVAADLMWNVALKLEDGGTTVAQQDLREALEKLSQAAQDPDISKLQLQEMIEDVKKKMQQYMQALANEMQQRMQQGGKTPVMSPELAQKFAKSIDFNKLLQQMQQLSNSKREDLQKMAQDLKNAIDNIDMKKMGQMQEQQMKAMEALQDMQDLIHRQQALFDRANKSDDPADTKENAKEQEKIRQQLGKTARKLAESGGDLPENLARADQAMKSSKQALDRGKSQESLPHQKTALDEMQKSLDDAVQKMAESMQQSLMSFGMMPNSGNYGQGFDPLGRNTDAFDDGSTKLPGESEQRRVQEIIRELRERSNEPNRTRVERDYIDRLLDQF